MTKDRGQNRGNRILPKKRNLFPQTVLGCLNTAARHFSYSKAQSQHFHCSQKRLNPLNPESALCHYISAHTHICESNIVFHDFLPYSKIICIWKIMLHCNSLGFAVRRYDSCAIVVGYVLTFTFIRSSIKGRRDHWLYQSISVFNQLYVKQSGQDRIQKKAPNTCTITVKQSSILKCGQTKI